MDLQALLEHVADVCARRDIAYALAGGLAASLYRQQPRLTSDLDFLLAAAGDSIDVAKQLIVELGLTAHPVRAADLAGGPLFARKRKSTPVCMVIGRSPDDSAATGLDFILPAMPWFADAFARAQQHCVDFGFARIPCLTAEDVIIAKLFAVKGDATRFRDLDDLQSIFAAQHPLDLAYLRGQMNSLALTMPAVLKSCAPKVLGGKLRK